MKKYTISILTYKAFPLVKKCVESVLAHSPQGTYNIILTDNGGGALVHEYFESIKASNPEDVEVIHNEKNLGFIIPNNEAMRMTKTKYFVMLNDDAQVPPGWLEALEKPFEEHPRAALSGLSGGCQSLTHEFHGRPHGDFEYLEGSCLMVHVGRVRPHGLFAPYLEFAYGEDSDLSLRMRRLGYTLHKVDLPLRHVRAQTAMFIPDIKAKQSRNHHVLRKKWSHYMRVRKFDYPIIVRRWGARGDAFLARSTVKQLHLENPLSPIFVETAFPEFFEGMAGVVKSDRQVVKPWDGVYINLDMAYEKRNTMTILDAYAEVAGLDNRVHNTRLDLSDKELAKVRELMPPPNVGRCGWIAVHAGPTTWQGKNWPMEKWKELLTLIRNKMKKKVVLIGHGDPTPLPCDLDQRGTGDWKYSASVIENAGLFIGVDSFPIHLAQAVGTTAIGLFGSTNHELILQGNDNTYVIEGDKNADDYRARSRLPGFTSVPSSGNCIQSISVEQVFEAVQYAYEPSSQKKRIPKPSCVLSV